jgi:hypothetical protein
MIFVCVVETLLAMVAGSADAAGKRRSQLRLYGIGV